MADKSQEISMGSGKAVSPPKPKSVVKKEEEAPKKKPAKPKSEPKPEEVENNDV